MKYKLVLCKSLVLLTLITITPVVKPVTSVLHEEIRGNYRNSKPYVLVQFGKVTSDRLSRFRFIWFPRAVRRQTILFDNNVCYEIFFPFLQLRYFWNLNITQHYVNKYSKENMYRLIFPPPEDHTRMIKRRLYASKKKLPILHIAISHFITGKKTFFFHRATE